ncbi:MAG: hypothetical protein WCC01_05070 [Acidimicrobiia bacterium]
MMMLVAIGLCGVALVGRWRLAAVFGAAVLVVAAPILAAVGILGLGVGAVLRSVLRPRVGDDDEALLAELASLGLSAGLTFTAAVEAATRAVPGEASDRLRRAGRTAADRDTVAAGDPGLFVVARRALATGASLLPAVAGYATALRDEERSRRLAAARRLPVKLLFPLALLILPGFLILTIGPALLGSLERLGL